MGNIYDPIDLSGLLQIPIKLRLNQEDLKIPIELLPKQYIDGTIRTTGSTRCKLIYGRIQNRGGYGSICLAERVVADRSHRVCVKVPHKSSFTLFPEAIIQWHASRMLEAAGIIDAIPPVYDIFQYAGETRFSMKFMEGMSCIDFIQASSSPARTLLEVLAQVSLLLAYLETTIYLDHRDMNAANIWVRPVETNYDLVVKGKRYSVSAPFQVVILDFGFSCLGSEETGNAVVSLSDGILPRIDPCPKEGRDLFQLISSIWSFPHIRYLMDESTQKMIETLLSYRNRPYASLVKETTETRWVYLLVSDSAFRHPPLHPLSLLELFRLKYETICKISE
jgi:serine/threonine protein kinase